MFAALLTITLFSSGAVAQTNGADAPSDGCTVVIDDEGAILDLLGGGDGGRRHHTETVRGRAPVAHRELPLGTILVFFRGESNDSRSRARAWRPNG